MAVWRDDGTADLCAADDLDEMDARPFDLERNGARYPLLAIREGDQVHVYHNACPHIGVPLHWGTEGMMNLQGTHLICSTHGAQFRTGDGYCIIGPCKGQSLGKVTSRIEDGRVIADLQP
tara:strand:- start:146 stop:505 length:360 start_codon:yes stop_codon:yes gene_type:complete